jgi:small subunit ribosomal protein S5
MSRNHSNQRDDQNKGEFIDRTVKIKRCAAVVKGGRRFSFAAMVVVGDGKGRVGFGYAKGNEVPPSVEKAKKQATAKLVTVPLEEGTIAHRVIGRYGTAQVVLLPARPGTGLIAGSAVRAVCEAAGIQNLLTKAYGTNNPVVVVKATINALTQLRTRQEYERLRGVSLT